MHYHRQRKVHVSVVHVLPGFFFTIVLVVTYPVPLHGQQQCFAAQIKKQKSMESKKILAQNNY